MFLKEKSFLEGFFDFVKNFCVVAVAGGLVMLAAPNGRLQRHVKFIISLCMVCALLSALVSAPAEIEKYLSEIEIEVEESVSAGGEDARLAVAKTAKSNMEAELCRLLCSRYGLAARDVYVVVTLDTRDLSAVEISGVTAFIAGADKCEGAKEYLAELFMSGTEIIIMEKG